MEFSAYDQEGRRKYLTATEGDAFLRRAREVMPQNEIALCETLYFTGCRLSECIQLACENFESEEGVIRIRSLKKRGKVHVRRLPIPPELSTLIKEILPQTGLIWNISRTTAWRRIKHVMRLMELSGSHACPNGLRHGFGVRAAIAGIPVTKIQQWMGHADVKTTAIYLNVQDEEERELMSRTW